MANYKNGTLYVWVTSNLVQRIHQHKAWIFEWFTKKYGLKKLVYYEECPNICSAILREKQLKAGNRQKKIDLINNTNPERRDLYEDIVE